MALQKLVVKPGTAPANNGKVSWERDWSRISDAEMAEMRKYVSNAKKCVGQTFTTNAGSSVQFPVIIPQIGKLFLGFAFLDDIDGTVTVSLNEETFINAVGCGFFQRNTSKDEFSPFPRPLGGLDQIKFEVTDSLSQSYQIAVYYI